MGVLVVALEQRRGVAPDIRAFAPQVTATALDRWLIAHLPDRPHRRPAVSVGLAELDRRGLEVGHVASMCGLSRRRFIRVFIEDVGMTPKRYSMVRRFQRPGAGHPEPVGDLGADRFRVRLL